jgi:hypothetical protein
MGLKAGGGGVEWVAVALRGTDRREMEFRGGKRRSQMEFGNVSPGAAATTPDINGTPRLPPVAFGRISL